MLKVIYSVLRGTFLTKGKKARRTWGFILFIVFLLLMMVRSAHSADEKVILISKLNIEKKKIKSEYVVMKVKLAKLKMESSVRERMQRKGITTADSSPEKIKVIVKR